jgi:hypothetical protein
LCNQHIYSPNRSRGVGPRWALVTPNRPLRCVAFDDVHRNTPEAIAWLESMKTNFNFQGQQDLVVPITRLDMKPGNDHVFVFEFQPWPHRATDRIASGGATDRTAH